MPRCRQCGNERFFCARFEAAIEIDYEKKSERIADHGEQKSDPECECGKCGSTDIEAPEYPLEWIRAREHKDLRQWTKERRKWGRK